jgi:4-amino-4-deoxy-L-arabinose transferase-like glycosyltransferase
LLNVAVTRPGLHYLISRFVSAAAGILTVVAVYALSLTGYRRPRAALLAAFSLVVCHVHVRDSHFATVDVLATFFVTLALVFSVRASEAGTARDFALAGLFAGLAASSKYNAGLVAIPIFVAALYRGREAFSRLALAAGAAAAFALTSPYVLLRFGGFRSDMSFLEEFLYRSGDLALWDHLRTTFAGGLGWPLYAAAVLGLVLAMARRRPRRRSALVRGPLSRSDLVRSHHLSPIRAAGGARPPGPRRGARSLPPRTRLFATARLVSGSALALVLLVPPLLDSAAFDRIAAREDTRLQAASFVAPTFEPQTRIHVCSGYGAPALNQDRRRPPAFVVVEQDCLSGTAPPRNASFLVTHEHRELSFGRLDPALARWLEEHVRIWKLPLQG